MAVSDLAANFGTGTHETLLNDTWTVYFHEPSDPDWTMGSYVRLDQISSIEAFWKVHEGVRPFLNRGMFFLMREHVFPCWDDPSNIKGGCISLKIPKEDVEAFWEKVGTRLLGETLVVPPGDCEEADAWSAVNGVSISPKRFFCICKLWLKETVLTDLRHFRIPEMFHGGAMYRSNMEIIRQNNNNNNNNNNNIPAIKSKNE
jgi:Eukaryotic initiation factor 4E